MKRILLYTFFGLSILVFSYAIYMRFMENGNFDPLDGVEMTKIAIYDRHIDTGEVDEKKLAKGEFYVKNIGENDLIISNVEVSCTCSSIALLENTIPPKDSISIIVEYSKKIPAHFYSDVIVHGNFPGSPELLSFEGFYNGNDLER